jgi:hypothetical protein
MQEEVYVNATLLRLGVVVVTAVDKYALYLAYLALFNSIGVFEPDIVKYVVVLLSGPTKFQVVVAVTSTFVANWNFRLFAPAAGG